MGKIESFINDIFLEFYMPVQRLKQSDMDLNLTGNDDPNKGLHLDHGESAPRVKEYYASRGIEKELEGDELVANGELFLNWLEKVFTQEEKQDQLISGFDCRFYPSFFKNGIIDIFYDIPRVADTSLAEHGIRLHEIPLAHSVPLHLRRKEGYDESAFMAFVMENFADKVQKYYNETIGALGDNPTFDKFSNKIKNSFTLEKIMMNVLDAAISGKIFSVDSKQEPRNHLNMHPKIYNIISLLGGKLEGKRQRKTRYVELDDSYGELAGTHPMLPEIKGKQIFEYKFTFTRDSLQSFCSSIGMTVGDYTSKYGFIVTPMLCAYSLVPALYNFGMQEHVNASLQAEIKKRFGVENLDEANLTKMYDGQAVVSDMRHAIPLNTVESETTEGKKQRQITDTEITALLVYEPSKRNPSLIPRDKKIKIGEETAFMRKTGIYITILDKDGHPYVGANGTGFEMVSKKNVKNETN